MGVKPVIDIDVNDERFRAFSELFQKYQAQVRALPGAWGTVNSEMQAGFETMTAALLAALELNKRSRDVTEDAANQSNRFASSWRNAASSSGAFASNVHRATMDFLRWTGAIEAIGGIIGIGGLWGLDKLAGTVGSGRRENQGLDITQGERVAFGLNYGRITDPNAFLGDVNAAAHDPAQVSRLYAAGLTEEEVSGRDTGQLAVSLMDKYKALVDQTDPALLGSVVRAHGGLISTEDAVRLKSLSPKEYGEIRSQTMHDQAALSMGDPMMKAWQDFEVQLRRGGMMIENAFVTGLTPLIPQLTRFSGILTGIIVDFMRWADKSHAIDKLGDAIKNFGDYLTSKEFREDLEMFKGDVVALGGAIHKSLQLLGLVPENLPDVSTPEGRAAAAAAPPEIRNKAEDPNSKGDFFQRFKSEVESQNPELTSRWAGLLPDIAHQESGVNTEKDVLPFDRLIAQFGKNWRDHVSEGERAAAAKYDPRWGGFTKEGATRVSSEGARGQMQLMPDTAKQYRVNPDDPYEARHGAVEFLDDLAKKYHDDIPKMLAAYNWGPGNLDKDITKYGDDWRKHLPAETAKYIKDVMNHADQRLNNPSKMPAPMVKIDVFNHTGSNVIVSSGQIAR